MTESPAQPIIGYRALNEREIALINEREIALINEIKETEKTVGVLTDKIAGTPAYPTPPSVTADLPSHDPHLVRLAKDYLMIGFMLLTRSIAKPGAPAVSRPPATLGE